MDALGDPQQQQQQNSAPATAPGPLALSGLNSTSPPLNAWDAVPPSCSNDRFSQGPSSTLTGMNMVGGAPAPDTNQRISLQPQGRRGGGDSSGGPQEQSTAKDVSRSTPPSSLPSTDAAAGGWKEYYDPKSKCCYWNNGKESVRASSMRIMR